MGPSATPPPPIPRLVLRKSGEETSSTQPSILFAGDFYASRDHPVQNAGDLFDPAVIGWIQHSSFSVVNFEGTLALRDSKGIRKDGPHLALSEYAPTLLQSAGFQAVTLANNHAMDYGSEGLRETLESCARSGLQHAGAGHNSDHAERALQVCLPGNIEVRILSLCEREFGVSENNGAGTAWLTSPQAENAVDQAKRESDVVIVCAHGGNELMPLPSAQRRQQLQRLVDAGADLVIGHHPHVPQGWEQYANGYIFYSLGDFYFDSTDGNRYNYRDWGFMVRASIGQGHITALEIVPYERRHDRVGLLGTYRDAASHVSYLEELASILTSPDFEGYWQELAVNRLSAYQPVFRSRFTYPRLSFRKRVKETLVMADELLSLWRPSRRHTALSTGNSQSAEKEALGTLNAVRCESHRWAIETAFAVLGGETQDRRTPEIKDKLKALGKFSAYRADISAY